MTRQKGAAIFSRPETFWKKERKFRTKSVRCGEEESEESPNTHVYGFATAQAMEALGGGEGDGGRTYCTEKQILLRYVLRRTTEH